MLCQEKQCCGSALQHYDCGSNGASSSRCFIIITERSNYADATRPIGLIQMCCRAGCRNVATFKAGHGLCHFHLHQKAEALSTTSKEGDEDQRSTTISDDVISNIAAFNSSDKNRVRMKDDTSKTDTFVVDLSDVPPQLPIPKLKRKRNKDKEEEEYSSKYTGVSWVKKKGEWRAQIFFKGKMRHLGNYADEVDAAVVYAQAFLKYRGQAALDKVRAKVEKAEEKEKEHLVTSSNVVGKKRASSTIGSVSSDSNVKEKKRRRLYMDPIDLSSVPPQLPIRRGDDAIKQGKTKFRGARYNKSSGKWLVTIGIKGKERYVGYYDTEEEAAVDYARAMFKYKGPAVVERARRLANIAAVDEARAKVEKAEEKEKEHLVSTNVVGKICASSTIGSVSSDSIVKKKRKRRLYNDPIDLSGVPPQLPIRRGEDAVKQGKPKFRGARYNKSSGKWLASIGIKGKERHVGYYDTEEEAAIDYARAMFKYKGPAVVEKARRSADKSYSYLINDDIGKAPCHNSKINEILNIGYGNDEPMIGMHNRCAFPLQRRGKGRGSVHSVVHQNSYMRCSTKSLYNL